MNRFLFSTILWFAALSASMSQDASLFNQVIASTGNSAVQQGLSYSYTLGEVVIATLSSGSAGVTQGFHQPEQSRIVKVQDPGLASWEIEVFPNPTSDWLTVRYNPLQGDYLLVSAVDLLGKVIFSNLQVNNPDGTLFDTASWQPGVYFLIIQDPATKASANVRVVRL